jgi:hypothetical protein
MTPLTLQVIEDAAARGWRAALARWKLPAPAASSNPKDPLSPLIWKELTAVAFPGGGTEEEKARFESLGYLTLELTAEPPSAPPAPLQELLGHVDSGMNREQSR